MVTWKEPRGGRENGVFVDSFILCRPGRSAETNYQNVLLGFTGDEIKTLQLTLFWEVHGQVSFRQLHTSVNAITKTHFFKKAQV